MSQWLYTLYTDWVRNGQITRETLFETTCLFCSSKLDTLKCDSRVVVSNKSENVDFVSSAERVCRVCGWWLWYESTRFSNQRSRRTSGSALYGAVGSLKELDVSDQSIPIEEIRSYLAAKYDARFQVDPWRFEEVVASVYRDIGYQSRVTARSGDGGIDVVLDGPGEALIGVQVKRYRDRIGVEQIRSFSGALFLEGLLRGVFVTTSDFGPGAEKAATISSARGIPIELVDSKRFFEVLGVAQRNVFSEEDRRKLPAFILETK